MVALDWRGQENKMGRQQDDGCPGNGITGIKQIPKTDIIQQT